LGLALTSNRLVTGGVAAAVFALAYRSGGYSFLDRNTVAVLVWLSVALLLGLGLLPLARISRPTLAAAGAFAALALWTLASAAWAPSAEDVLTEFNRISFYLAVFALAAVGSTRSNLVRWADGLALGIATTAVIALTSRFFPEPFALRGLPSFLPASQTRLSFPIDYWNGLAIFCALAVPLLLRLAVVGSSAVHRALGMAAVPLVTVVVFLASSRGGVAVAGAGAVAFVALTARPWRAAAASATAFLGSAAAFAVLLGRDELVNGPLGSAAAVEQGRSAALLVTLIALATGAAWSALTAISSERFRVPRGTGRAAVLAAGVAAAALIVAADPVRQLETFKEPPGQLTSAGPNFAQAHLLSGGGSGRWQFWSAAFDQFREHPLWGGGAGTYESWWTEHASFSYFVRDAHSLYLEVLGELGLIGFALLVAGFGTVVVAGLRSVRAERDEERVLRAALLATAFAFLVGIAVDWIWELAAVSAIGFAAFGLLLQHGGEPEPQRSRFGLGVAVILAAWILALLQVLPLLAEIQLRQSQAEVRGGDLRAAAAEAAGARDLAPWAATPHTQLALVAEAAGDFRAADRHIESAIDRDRRDWRLWLIATRLRTKSGEIDEARRSLDRARQLNPRSPLFSSP